MSSSQHSYASCSSATLPLPPVLPPKPTIPAVPAQPKQNPNDTLNSRQLICRLLRVLFILLLFSAIFYYFYHEAEKLQNQNTRNTYEASTTERRLFIKEMTRSAWTAYVRYAWGQDALEPETRTAYNSWLGPNGGFTLIQSLSTLWLMDFPEEFARGRAWIAENFNFSQIDQDLNVFLAVTEVLGPLLSCYALTQDQMFLNKAQEVASALEPAYRTGLPLKKLNPRTQIPFGQEVFLGELGGQHLEYYYLFSLTRDPHISQRFIEARDALQKIPKPKKGLYMSELDVFTTEWSTDISTFFSPASTFYSYLVKSYFQSRGTDLQALQMYQQAIQAANRNFLFNTSIADLQYVRDYYYLSADTTATNYRASSFGDFMLHDGCYLGGMFGLGASALEQLVPVGTESSAQRKARNEVKMHLELAVNLTETCRFSSLTRTGLPPNYLFVNEPEKIQALSYFNEYHLSPELAESYFILWRLTKDPKYRDWSWQLAQSIHAHCLTPSGAYSNIANVEQIPTAKTNYMPPHFLGATLKYLYLTFSDDSVMPLDSWVFNRAGQPLPCCGSSCR